MDVVVTPGALTHLVRPLAIHRGVDCRDLARVVCPECEDKLLAFSQPDPRDPAALLAACRTCRGWYLCDITRGVLVDLDRLALWQSLAAMLDARRAGEAMRG